MQCLFSALILNSFTYFTDFTYPGIKTASKMMGSGRTNFDPLINSYTHAITALYPQERYSFISPDSYFLVLYTKLPKMFQVSVSYIYLSIYHLSVCICLSLHVFLCMLACLPAYMSVCLSACMSASSYVRLPACLYIYNCTILE